MSHHVPIKVSTVEFADMRIELLISTTHLLLAVEKSLSESRSDGKAMIFGSFAPAATSSGAAA